jgi:RND family efflux transporter MFP subunit
VHYYQDAMNPAHRSDKPGTDSMGMPLVPVYADEQPTETSARGVLHLSPEKQQLIGIQTAAVEERNIVRTIRAVARLNYDETKVAHIHSKVEGWIDRVFVNYAGQLVEKGQPLFAIYSPDLVATQEEYLLALKGRQTLRESPIVGVSDSSEALLRASRRRLELWDLTDDQIKALEERGKPQKDITVYSSVSGFVVDRKAYENVRVTADLDLYTIADFSTVWAEADVFEYEASMVSVGQRAVMTLPGFPGAAFAGRISYIYPQLNPDTHTLRVRLDLQNPKFLLKPGMYSNVEIKVGLGRSLVVPPDAVLDSGTHQMVFLDRGNGYFEPRGVELGEPADDYAVITHGLRRGDRVVTRANFLLDSESNLRQALSGMQDMPGMQQGGEAVK